MAEGVTPRTILEVCDRDTAYEEGGRSREPWWRQAVARNQLSAKLKEILAVARDWRWKSGRGGGDMDAEEP